MNILISLCKNQSLCVYLHACTYIYVCVCAGTVKYVCVKNQRSACSLCCLPLFPPSPVVWSSFQWSDGPLGPRILSPPHSAGMTEDLTLTLTQVLGVQTRVFVCV